MKRITIRKLRDGRGWTGYYEVTNHQGEKFRVSTRRVAEEIREASRRLRAKKIKRMPPFKDTEYIKSSKGSKD